jgi:hypothetical protein
MPRVGFEPTISDFELKTFHASNRAAAVIDPFNVKGKVT